jgi:hypothetical protein
MEDKIEAIKAVSALKSGKVDRIFNDSSSLKNKVSYNTDMDGGDEQLFVTNTHRGKLCLVDWRDDLENVIWI